MALDFLKKKYQENGDKPNNEALQFDKIIAKHIDTLCQNKKCNFVFVQNTEELTNHRPPTKNKIIQAITNTDDILKNKAKQILSNIIKDVRIFSGTNLVIFTLILMTALFTKNALMRSLILPTFLIFISSFTAIFVYVFVQNWFYTILLSSYWGFGYSAMVLVIFFFLYDIVFRGASVTDYVLAFFEAFLSLLFSKV
jgi:hypothetical protein